MGAAGRRFPDMRCATGMETLWMSSATLLDLVSLHVTHMLPTFARDVAEMVAPLCSVFRKSARS
jgi:hypothetical protein